MNEEQELSEFLEAFGGEDGNHTEQADDGAQGNATEAEGASDVGTESVTDEAGKDGVATQQNPEEDGESSDGKPEEETEGDTFILKVNKEEKTYSRDEVIALAQKGADYDRVKEQLSQSRETATGLQSQLDKMQETVEILSEIAKESNTDVESLLFNMRLAVLHKQGLSEDAAKERLLRLKAEKENERLRAKPTEKEQEGTESKERARHDLEEFRKEYPDVELTDELLEKLSGDIHGGASMVSAYRKYENAQKDAKIAELQSALAAQKKNQENRAASPGSQKDSGGQRSKSDYDDFMKAFM